MKAVMKFLAAVLAAVLFLCGAQAFAAAPSLLDGAGILTETEQATLQKEIQAIEAKHKIRVGVVTVNQANTSAMQYADQILDRVFTDGENGNMVLVLSMADRDWYVATDVKMKAKIVDGEGGDYLKEAFLPSLGDGRYAEGFENYVRRVDEMVTYYEEEGEPYLPSEQFNPLALGVAALLAILAGFGVRSVLIRQMSNVMPEPAASAYLDRESFRLTEQDDTYLYTNVMRRPKAKANANSGGGGSGGSSGGHGGFGGKF